VKLKIVSLLIGINTNVFAVENHACKENEIIYYNCQFKNQERISLCATEKYPERVYFRTSKNEIIYPGDEESKNNTYQFRFSEDAINTGASTLFTSFTHDAIDYSFGINAGSYFFSKEKKGLYDVYELCLTVSETNDSVVGFNNKKREMIDNLFFKEAIFYKWLYGATIKKEKAWLYAKPEVKTKQYLIKGDYVKLIQRQGDKFDPGAFIKIEYDSAKKGKIRKWLHCSAIDAC